MDCLDLCLCSVGPSGPADPQVLEVLFVLKGLLVKLDLLVLKVLLVKLGRLVVF